LLKPLFLPIPREALAFKPESMMQLFTQIFAPDWWAEGGSLPVMFAADMFLNFHYLGLVPFVLVWLAVNHLFERLHAVELRSFAAWSFIFLSTTVLMFARGSGIELWLLYYLLAAPVFLMYKLASNAVQVSAPPHARWVV